MQIAFDGKDPETKEPSQYIKTFELNPKKMPLSLIEGLEEGRIGLSRRAIKKYLDLTQEESEQLTMEHLEQLLGAVKEASNIPNG